MNKSATRIFKLICIVVTVGSVVACSHLQEFDEVDPAVVGTWSGEGRFYDRALAHEYGKFPVSIEVQPDRSVRGSVGSARLGDAVIKRRPQDHLIEATLIGSVFESGRLAEEHKDCAVLILSPPDGDAVEGDVHLKSNLQFDLTMRAGAVELVRSGARAN